MRLKDVENYKVHKKFLEYPDLENMFNIYEGKNGMLKMNLNSTMYIELPSDKAKTHTITHDSFWPTISYQIYGTTRYAWVLMKINKVSAKNIFYKIPAGTTILCLERSILDTVIGSLAEEK